MLCLRDALAFFETVFVARDAVFAARPRTSLPPRDLDALDLDGAVFAGVLLRAAPVLDTVFLEAAGFCFLAPDPSDYDANGGYCFRQEEGVSPCTFLCQVLEPSSATAPQERVAQGKEQNCAGRVFGPSRRR